MGCMAAFSEALTAVPIRARKKQAMNLLLKGLSWHDGNQIVSGDIRISGEIISQTGKDLNPEKGEQVAHFCGDYVYAGLINAHDHLEMNLYPKLGTPPYQNYVEWAKDIYHPDRSPLREIENLNIRTRLLWGGLKNLISGVTTVIHHNPWHRLLGKNAFPTSVLRISWAHSLQLEKGIINKVRRLRRSPLVIHAAEGVDALASSEVATLYKMKLLNEGTVLVHAIALNDEQIDLLADNNCAIVWCPASNLYMFNQTASIKKLKPNIRLLLGSDSTLTGSPTLLHELKVARQTRLATAAEIYAMVTRTPSQVFRLPEPAIAAQSPADLFIARSIKRDHYDNLLELEPRDISMVLRNGLPRLANATIDFQWTRMKHVTTIQGVPKFCDVDVSSLRKEIGKRVSSETLQSNALWGLFDE